MSHPLVNIVRNALTLLVLVVSRPLSGSRRDSVEVFGFRAIKPALDLHPEFLESLVQRLSASDHTLCANALQLINALMRDAVVNGGEFEWPKFIKRLQDLGVIGGVGMLMRGDAAADLGSSLAAAILEFQTLTKVLLRKWKEVRVNLELAEHKRALKQIHLLSNPEPYEPPETNVDSKSAKRHHPEKWRRLGFETESPAWEFDETGYLGMMDLVDYARKNEDQYQKILLEQSVQPREQRCPIARASLSVTLILYEHFEIDDAMEVDGDGTHVRSISGIGGPDKPPNLDRLFRPLLLQWTPLHVAALNAFLRLWKAAGADTEDFYKIEEVVRVVVERIVGRAKRKTHIGEVEEGLRGVSLETARNWQMDGLDEIYRDAWSPYLVQVRDQLHQESLQFMREQRIRCLLQGSWFPATAVNNTAAEVAWRFVRLSHNRRHLHYQKFAEKGKGEPALTELPDKIDLNNVTSVDSNVSTTEQKRSTNVANGSTETLKESDASEDQEQQQLTTTKITILGTRPKTSTLSTIPTLETTPSETTLLELFPQSSAIASEWLDGLLMLLNQQPITKDTTRLVEMMEDWGVRLRMLNLRWEDLDWEALEARVKGVKVEEREVPSREGVDDEFYYAMGEAKS